MSFEDLKDKVLSWAYDKGLLHAENADKQFMKFIEEVFEFGHSNNLPVVEINKLAGGMWSTLKEING